MKKMQHKENMESERNDDTWKKCNTKKSAAWKECNMKKVGHEKSATSEKWNMEIVQHEQSIVTEWTIEKSAQNECKRVHKSDNGLLYTSEDCSGK